MCDAKSESACFHTDIDGLQAVHSLSVSTRSQGKKNHWCAFCIKTIHETIDRPVLSKIGPDSNNMNQSYEQKYLHAKLCRVCVACGFIAEHDNNPARSLPL